jgi:hypothetical protein
MELQDADKKFENDVDSIYNQVYNHQCLINLESKFKEVWDYIQIVAILYITITAPFKVSFLNDYEYLEWDLFDHFVDFLLLIDLVLTFFTPYYEEHKLITNKFRIAIRYIKLWFWLDLLSIIPFQLFMENMEIL